MSTVGPVPARPDPAHDGRVLLLEFAALFQFVAVVSALIFAAVLAGKVSALEKRVAAIEAVRVTEASKPTDKAKPAPKKRAAQVPSEHREVLETEGDDSPIINGNGNSVIHGDGNVSIRQESHGDNSSNTVIGGDGNSLVIEGSCVRVNGKEVAGCR